MDNTFPVVAAEVALVLVGAFLLVRGMLRYRSEPSHYEPVLPAWDVSISDFIFYCFIAIAGALFFQFTASFSLKYTKLDSDSRLVLTAAAMDLGIITGIALFHQLKADTFPLFIHKGFKTLRSGVLTLLIALPLVFTVMFVWQAILNAFHIPIVKQEMVDLLMNSSFPLARNTLILVAVIAAPTAEELMFRAGLYRFLRTRTHRWVARLVPAILFAAAHGSLTYFPPLVVLGIIFALAYERTGTIGTTIVAHALFNLNSILMILGNCGS